MEIFITTDKDDHEWHLTTDSSQSHYGIPVLRTDDPEVNSDFGPADMIGEPTEFVCAAEIVAAWAKQDIRTVEEKEAVKSFLRQWPDGPQV